MSERTADSEQGAPGAAEAAPEADAPDEEVIVDAEVVEDEPSAEAEGQEVAEELDELAQAQQERDNYLELAQRARADFENYRRRVAGETAEAERRGRVAVAKGLLPAIDNLERALAADESGAGDGLAAGVRLVLDELRTALERAGVHSYDPVGERFDPNLHEAISTGASEGAEPGTVLETLERGYRVDAQVIRPARVIVSG
jgi:molecular chaperone GrpE